MAKLDKKEKSETDSIMPNHPVKRPSESSIPVLAAKLGEGQLIPIEISLAIKNNQSHIACADC